MPKPIDSIGRKPEKKKVEPIAVHKAGEVFRPRGENPHAGEQVKPKDYVDPKSLEKKSKVLTAEEHEASQRHASTDRKKTLRKVAIGVGIALLVVLISIPIVNTIQANLKKQNEKKYVNTACTVQHTDELDQAITAVNAQDKAKVEELATKIKTYQYYELDQNCMAIITWQGIMKADVNSARSSQQNIASVYSQSQDKGADGVIYTSNPDKLAKIIDGLETSQKQQRQNDDIFNGSQPNEG